MRRFPYTIGIVAFLFLALVVLHFYVGLSFAQKYISGETAKVAINDVRFHVETVATQEEIAQGLSNRSRLPKGFGMLFVFDEPVAATFWMKDMRFALDIVWIRNGKVTGIDRDVAYPQPRQDPEERESPGPVTHVLEVTAGESQSFSVGDSVLIH